MAVWRVVQKVGTMVAQWAALLAVQMVALLECEMVEKTGDETVVHWVALSVLMMADHWVSWLADQ